MKIKAIAVGIFVVLCSGSVSAQNTAFDDAMNGWLNGPEASNLRALSELAAGGNTDAQMLLGQIDRDTPPGGYSDYLADMEHDKREALLRSGSVGNSTNWLLALSDPSLTSFGETVFGYRVSRDVVGNAVAMQKHEEVAAAEFILWDTLIGGRFDLVNAMSAENYGLSDAGFLQWITDYMGGENKAITMNRLLEDTSPSMISGLLSIKRLARILSLERNFSDKADQFITIMNGKGYDLPDDANLVNLNADIARIAETNPPLNLVVRACAKCTQETVDYNCIVQSMEIIGGYKELLLVRTPVEKVIPATSFIESERALTIFENMLRSRSDYHKRPIRSSCIADFLAKES